MKKLTLAFLLFSAPAFAKLNVVTTTPDLRSLVSEIGGSNVDVISISKGTQDPHFIEAKPSYMTKASKADLVVAVGLELEIGWLPPILSGARNPNVMPSGRGYLEVGPLADPLEVPSGKVTRAEGDVHPLGNPHCLLDPIRAGEVAEKIAAKMGELDSPHAAEYAAKAKALHERLEAKAKGWSERVKNSGVKAAISYHKTLSYFFDRFKIENPAILEPKPGIPPTAGHTLEVIQLIKEKKVPIVLVENFFDPSITKRITEQAPSVRVAVVPVEVEGAPGVASLDDLYETLVKALEGK